MVKKMPSDARTKINLGDVKSTGTMVGEVFIDNVYNHAFKADLVNYVNNKVVIQIHGSQGDAQQSTTITVGLKPGTPSGSYEFGDPQITDLTYFPPREEALWKVTGGGVNVTFNEAEYSVRGTLQVLATRANQTLEANVGFHMRGCDPDRG